MATSPPQAFPPRKRRLISASSFISPKLTDRNLIHSLLLFAQEISSLTPFQFLLKHHSVSLIRKSKLLAIPALSPCAILCFEEMHVLLHRVKALIEDCSNGSKIWLLMQTESELWTLLDIFPLKEIDLNDDVEELIILIRNQLNSQTKVDHCVVDPRDNELRHEVLAMLERIKREIVPDHSELAKIFTRLALRDASSCREEIENLEEEILNQGNEKSKSEVIIALIGLVRYAKCVLFRASTSNTNTRSRETPLEAIFPADFRCPISLELMRDPVVVATRQTYDRESIKMWIESGLSWLIEFQLK